MQMDFKLTKAPEERVGVIKNLMQFYMYDFSEYLKLDVEEDGLFAAYPALEDYWKDERHKFPYLITVGEKYIGFGLVRLIESAHRSYFSMAEFFIMKKYRREGIGNAVAKQLFNLHKGQWEVYQKECNKPAKIFWNKVINEFTREQFEERLEDGKRVQSFMSS